MTKLNFFFDVLQHKAPKLHDEDWEPCQFTDILVIYVLFLDIVLENLPIRKKQ